MKQLRTIFIGMLVLLSYGARAQYCTPTYTNLCNSNDYIDNFYTTGGTINISNLVTGCNGQVNNYIYYPAMTVSQVQGASFSFNVQSGPSWSQGFAIWVDWNGDNDFADTGEDVWNSVTAGTTLFTGVINVPVSAPPGVKRMRVICSYNSVPANPCGSYSFGETEDYNINVQAGSTYCTPTYTNLCTTEDYINSFYTTGGVANISNMSTGCNGQTNNYIYYSSLSASQGQGLGFSINVQSGSQWGQGFAIWIDWNNDNDFSDVGEAVWNSGSYGTNLYTGTITVPLSATTGVKRMRVRCQYNAVPADPCINYTYGETEDYNINVLPGGGGGGPCTGIVNITACGAGNAQTSNHSGSGAGWDVTSCGWNTPGQENIFQFTPSATGIYSIAVTSSSGSYIDYFYKEASLGCDALSWTCIDDISIAGTYGSFMLTAGTIYYFLLDAENTTACNQTFYIICPSTGVSCPPGATIIENEPDCYADYVDATNGGCNSTPEVFTELTGCHDVVCGKAGTYLTGGTNEYRDTDWYRLALNGSTTVNMKAVADFPLQILVIDLNPGCASHVVIGTANVLAGDTAYITTTFGPGTMAYWVGPDVFTGVPCGSNYVMYCNAGTLSDPPAPAATSNPSCGPTQLSPMIPPPDAIYYWQGTSCGSDTGNSTVAAYPVSTSGTYYVRAQSSTLGCWSACSSVSVTVNAQPGAAGTISGTAAVCQNTTGIAYSIPPVSGATSYVWNYTGSGITINGAGAGITIDFSPAATSGDLTVYGTDGSCSGAPSAAFTITVNPAPAAAGSITGNGQICLPDSGVAYSIAAIPFATTYTWSYSGSGAIINGGGTNITIDFPQAATSGNLTVYGTNACGNGTASAAFPVSVNNSPGSAGTITGTATICQGASNVPYNVPVIANASAYVWNYSGSGTTISGSGPNITINFSSSATSGNLTVYGTNTCGSGALSPAYAVSVSVIPGPAGNITGTASICQGASGIVYSIPVIADAASYVWNYTGSGATIFGTGNSVAINFASNATSGILTVQGHNSCGDGTVSSGYPITVNHAPVAAGNITGTAVVCEGMTSVPYSVTPITGAIVHHWTYSGTGATINGSGSAVTMDFPSGSTGGTLSVYGSNNCGNGSAANFSIIVDPCTGTIESEGTHSMLIYPDPVRDVFTVEYNNGSVLYESIQIINILGRVVSCPILTGNDRKSMQIDMTSQPDGYYYLRLVSGRHIYVRSFVVSR